MFTGIIECVGEVMVADSVQGNLNLKIRSDISSELKIDQSVSHNGVCLTVVEQQDDWHRVQVVEESLKKSNFIMIKVGDRLNLERSLPFNGRLDGHIVQGHVDEMITCMDIQQVDGSWYVKFQLAKENERLIISKGSICINGVSLTVAELNQDNFTVAIIPYTLEHTTFSQLKSGHQVNIEYDVLGKYVDRHLSLFNR